jgi:hypothetical protein
MSGRIEYYHFVVSLGVSNLAMIEGDEPLPCPLRVNFKGSGFLTHFGPEGKHLIWSRIHEGRVSG